MVKVTSLEEFQSMSISSQKRVAKLVLKTIEDLSSDSRSFKENVKKFEIDDILTIFPYEVKKALKSIYKKATKHEYNPMLFKKGTPNVVNQGVHYDSDDYDSSWQYWYLFEATSEQEVIDTINKYGKHYIYIEADEIHSPYDCTGQTFSSEMYINQVGENRFLATKSYGIDVWFSTSIFLYSMKTIWKDDQHEWDSYNY